MVGVQELGRARQDSAVSAAACSVPHPVLVATLLLLTACSLCSLILILLIESDQSLGLPFCIITIQQVKLLVQYNDFIMYNIKWYIYTYLVALVLPCVSYHK